MKQLEELEKKVLQIIKKNKELLDENTLLKLENDELNNKSRQFETAMINKNKSSESLEKEKMNIKSSIEELLNSISSLEAKNEEATK
jgi:regulator of replication initiation timing